MVIKKGILTAISPLLSQWNPERISWADLAQSILMRQSLRWGSTKMLMTMSIFRALVCQCILVHKTQTYPTNFPPHCSVYCNWVDLHFKCIFLAKKKKERLSELWFCKARLHFNEEGCLVPYAGKNGCCSFKQLSRKRSLRSSSIWSIKTHLSTGFRYREGKLLSLNPPSPEASVRTYLFETLAGIVFLHFRLETVDLGYKAKYA